MRKTIAANAPPPIPPAPIARLEPVKDTYFGETLTDPYRWMENDKDADWLPFLKGHIMYAPSSGHTTYC